MASSLLFIDQGAAAQDGLTRAIGGAACSRRLYTGDRHGLRRDVFDPLADLVWASPRRSSDARGAACSRRSSRRRSCASSAERALGSVSRDRLIDLTDLEQPLLQKMAREAPGSWEHARAMANLAEAAAAAIGADALLTRVGAYYHDLGKTIQPKYFVENLAPRRAHRRTTISSPTCPPTRSWRTSSRARRSSARRGIPEPVVEFAYTHHGTQVDRVFLAQVPSERGNPKKLARGFLPLPGDEAADARRRRS